MFLLVLTLMAACNLPTPTLAPVGLPTLDPTAIILTAYARLTEQPIPPSGAVDTEQPQTPTSGQLPAATATQDIHFLPTASETVSLTPGSSASPTQSVPMINASLNTNCRTGPGLVYGIVGYLQVGEPSQVVGRYQGDSWWLIQHPTQPNRTCWVWSRTTSVTGDISGLPFVQAPPTPTRTKTPTNTPMPSTPALPATSETPGFPETPTSTEAGTLPETPTSTEAPTSTETPLAPETPTLPPAPPVTDTPAP